MSSRKSRGRKLPPLSGDLHSDDGVDPREFFGGSSRKPDRRKGLQLCAQVARTLDLVLSGGCGDPILGDLQVVSVTVNQTRGASGSGCLLVTLEMRGAASPERVQEALGRLAQARGMLRSEVAASISRKRVPELTFRVLAAGEARP
jgi:ribosome-binding factor A